MRLAVVGSGYVGLVSGACFAELGHHVICIDNDSRKIANLNRGQIPIFEPGLEDMIKRNAVAGRLEFTDEMALLREGVDAVFLAVGTPLKTSTQTADLSSLFSAVRTIVDNSPDGLLIVIKSTVPTGTSDAVEHFVRDLRPDLDFSVASNPEFLREGSAIADFMSPDRIVCGSQEAHVKNIFEDIYRDLSLAGAPLLFVSRRSAELVKCASNAFLAIKISFINEIADLCEAADADIDEVAHGIGLDQRIGSAFLRAGPGYGGSCFPKDAAALLATAQEYAINLRLVESATLVNAGRKRAMARRIVDAVGGEVRNRRIAILGLTFKPNTDDMREAPSIAIIEILTKMGAVIRVYDPEGMAASRHSLADVTYTRDAYECAHGADCAVLLTEWDEFINLDVTRLARVMHSPVFVDLRNGMDKDTLLRAGFAVHGIGRKPAFARGANILPMEEHDLPESLAREWLINSAAQMSSLYHPDGSIELHE